MSEVWKSPNVVSAYLTGVRAAIPLAAEQIDTMLRLIEANGGVRRFLDLGGGDGVLAAAILDRYPQAVAVVTDFSQPMLDAALARLGARAVCLNSDYGSPAWIADVEPHAPFDAIVSGYSIHHQEDDRKRAVYREIFDLLALGGIFVNVEHVASPSDWVESVHDGLFIDRLHRLHPERSREDVAREFFYRPDKSANILALVETQCGWLREIGFADADCYLKVFELAVFGGRKPRPDAAA